MRPVGRITVVASTIVIAAALAALLLTGGADTYKVTAVFDDVRGLIAGGDVRAGGVNVGHVDAVTLGPDGRPRVVLSIDEDFRLRRTAFADIHLQSNAGALNRYVDLRQGSGPELADGAVLGAGQTDQPVNLDDALSALDVTTRADLRHVLAAADGATTGRGDAIAASLRHSAGSLSQTAALLREVDSDRYALKTLVRDGRTVVGALATDPQRLGLTAERLASLLDVTARRDAQLRATAHALGPALTATRTTLEHGVRALPEVRGLLTDVTPLLPQIHPTIAVLKPASAAAAPLLDEARRLVAAAPRQLRALQPVIRSANQLFPLLKPTLARLGPLLDQLRTHAPEFTGFFTLFADATANYDAVGNVIRVVPIEIETPGHTNVVDSSSNAAGLLARPFLRDPGALEGEPWKDFASTFVGGGAP